MICTCRKSFHHILFMLCSLCPKFPKVCQRMMCWYGSSNHLAFILMLVVVIVVDGPDSYCIYFPVVGLCQIILLQDQKVTLAGGGLCDSPGYSPKYGTCIYSLKDTATKLTVDF